MQLGVEHRVVESVELADDAVGEVLAVGVPVSRRQAGAARTAVAVILGSTRAAVCAGGGS